MTPDTALLVFGKSPLPGQVKTRLIPGLSAAQAASLYRRMLSHALHTAVESGLGPVTLYASPHTRCPQLRELAQRHGTGIAPQEGADLGERMLRALCGALAGHARALLIGSDCPALRPDTLREADRVLRDGQTRVVLVPAADGGYVLVGGVDVCAAMFHAMPWGTRHVMPMTRARLGESGVRWQELSPLRDVDRVQDLDLLPSAFGCEGDGAKFLT